MRLRLDKHAQYEIRVYAEAIADILAKVVPVAWSAFEDYILYSVTFSRTEISVLKSIFSDKLNIDVSNIYDSINNSGLSIREKNELLDKLKINNT